MLATTENRFLQIFLFSTLLMITTGNLSAQSGAPDTLPPLEDDSTSKKTLDGSIVDNLPKEIVRFVRLRMQVASGWWLGGEEHGVELIKDVDSDARRDIVRTLVIPKENGADYEYKAEIQLISGEYGFIIASLELQPPGREAVDGRPSQLSVLVGENSAIASRPFFIVAPDRPPHFQLFSIKTGEDGSVDIDVPETNHFPLDLGHPHIPKTILKNAMGEAQTLIVQYSELLRGIDILTGDEVFEVHRKHARHYRSNAFTHITNIGDVDDDGIDDFVGSHHLDSAGPDRDGFLIVYSGRTGNTIFSKRGRKDQHLALSVVGMNDVNDDSASEIAVLQRIDETQFVVWLISGREGQIIWKTPTLTLSEDFQRGMIYPIEDMDNDKFEELLVVDYPDQSIIDYEERRSVYVISGKDGSILDYKRLRKNEWP